MILIGIKKFHDFIEKNKYDYFRSGTTTYVHDGKKIVLSYWRTSKKFLQIFQKKNLIKNMNDVT